MRTYRKIQAEELASRTCDRCNRTDDPDEPIGADYLTFSDTASFGSPFGDGTHVDIDLCPYCIKDVLYQWLHFTKPSDY